MSNKTDFDDVVCVILAGGPGKRMASNSMHKVCSPISGTPTIVRAIDTYKNAGLGRFLVVVGYMAEQVMSTVARTHPEVEFVYQANPRGTGHAAGVAAQSLEDEGYHGRVVVVAGDVVTRPEIVRRLLDRSLDAGVDLVLTAVPKQGRPNAGRVVPDKNGAVAAVVELPDIRQARANGTDLRVGPDLVSANQVEERSRFVNASLYAFRFPPFLEALRQLSPENAQSEIYLTDTVEMIARRGRAEVLEVPEATDLMAFNTPTELKAIEVIVSRRERVARVSPSGNEPDSRTLRPAGEWLQILQNRGSELRREMREVYGLSDGLIEDRRLAMTRLVELAVESFGLQREIIISRAPGRINLMGRHVDHRGGDVNGAAVDREVLLVAAPRQDDKVTLRNLEDGLYPRRDFHISDLLDGGPRTGWLDFLDSSAVRRALNEAPSDWSHYARAPLLRLQYERDDIRLKGMDCLVSGNIPVCAGLSSSSALVVAFAKAAVALNGLGISLRDLVELCGEAEWFVGSRGGSADHAAILTGKVGGLSRIGFFPFRVVEEVPFPSGVELVIADSGEKAMKSKGAPARDVFNQRVACYEIAERLFRHTWPLAADISHLRDLLPSRLLVGPSEVYRAISRLPDHPNRHRLRELLPEDLQTDLDRIFATHADLGDYDLRGVTLYGIGECVRSGRFAGLLKDRDMSGIGRLMRFSHDGDRLWSFASDGAARRFVVRTDVATLDRLAKANSDISEQPGRYACSTREIDRIVDAALETNGVIGAQLAGGGLGGCAMVLVGAESTEILLDRLGRLADRGDEGHVGLYVCHPIAGAGLFSV